MGCFAFGFFFKVQRAHVVEGGLGETKTKECAAPKVGDWPWQGAHTLAGANRGGLGGLQGVRVLVILGMGRGRGGTRLILGCTGLRFCRVGCWGWWRWCFLGRVRTASSGLVRSWRWWVVAAGTLAPL